MGSPPASLLILIICKMWYPGRPCRLLHQPKGGCPVAVFYGRMFPSPEQKHSSCCFSDLTGEHPDSGQDHPYITLGTGGVQGRTRLRPPAPVSLPGVPAAAASQPRTRGQGFAQLQEPGGAACVRACACAPRGRGGRRAPRGGPQRFPLPRASLRSLLPVRPSQTHVCKGMGDVCVRECV